MILAALAVALLLVLALPADPITGACLDRAPTRPAPLPPAASARAVYRSR